jgi:aminoglycoside 2''-phosphotransferase
VFRFLREAARRPLFRAELTLLARLDGACGIPVPRYDFVSAAGDFGGYRRIEGVPMRPAVFAALTPRGRARILDQLADFLRLIHALPPALIMQEGGAIAREWTGADWRARWRAERRAEVAKVVDGPLLRQMDRFYDEFAAAPPPPREVLTHGDLSDEHMLVSPGDGRLAGLIDFGDACLGDPAYDLTFFFAYGEASARRVRRLYDPAGADPTLLDRARMSYARFRIEQLRRAVDYPSQTAELLLRLPPLLAEISKARAAAAR